MDIISFSKQSFSSKDLSRTKRRKTYDSDDDQTGKNITEGQALMRNILGTKVQSIVINDEINVQDYKKVFFEDYEKDLNGSFTKMQPESQLNILKEQYELFDGHQLTQTQHKGTNQAIDIQDQVVSINKISEKLSGLNDLIELKLINCSLLPIECERLVKSCKDTLAQVRVLDLSLNPIKFIGLLHLLNKKHSHLYNLESLILVSCGIKNTQIKAIGSLYSHFNNTYYLTLSKLTYLNLSYNNKIGKIVQVLMGSDNTNSIIQVQQLKDIRLVECALTDKFTLKWLAKVSDFMIDLRSIDLSYNRFHDFKTITQVLNKITTLQSISLSVCELKIKKVEGDCQMQTYPIMFENLTFLDLSNSINGDKQLRVFLKSVKFRSLEFLRLKNCNISKHGFRKLLLSQNLLSLKVLMLKDNNIDKLINPLHDKNDSEVKTMKLEVLDLRGNMINNLDAFYPHFPRQLFTQTLILLDDNPLRHEKLFFMQMNHPSIISVRANAFLLAESTQIQRDFLEQL
eukprot:403348020